MLKEIGGLSVPRIFNMGFSLLRGLEFFVFRKMECPKLKSTCYAGGDKLLYKKSPFRYNRVVQALLQERKGDFMANKNNDLAHKMDVQISYRIHS